MQPSNYDMSFSAWRVMVFAGNRRLAKSISRTFVRKRSQGGRAFMITKEKLPIDTLFFRDHVRRRCWLTPGGGRRDGCAAWCGWEPGGATGRGGRGGVGGGGPGGRGQPGFGAGLRG